MWSRWAFASRSAQTRLHRVWWHISTEPWLCQLCTELVCATFIVRSTKFSDRSSQDCFDWWFIIWLKNRWSFFLSHIWIFLVLWDCTYCLYLKEQALPLPWAFWHQVQSKLSLTVLDVPFLIRMNVNLNDRFHVLKGSMWGAFSLGPNTNWTPALIWQVP